VSLANSPFKPKLAVHKDLGSGMVVGVRNIRLTNGFVLWLEIYFMLEK
jgi:hypothetical protein